MRTRTRSRLALPSGHAHSAGIKPRARRLTDLGEKGRPYFADAVEWDQEAVKKHLSAPGTGDHLQALSAAFAGAGALEAQGLEAALRALAEERASRLARSSIPRAWL